MKKKNKAEKKIGQGNGAEVREDKKIDLPKHGYPKPAEGDTQLKNQPEFIEPAGNKKGADRQE